MIMYLNLANLPEAEIEVYLYVTRECLYSRRWIDHVTFVHGSTINRGPPKALFIVAWFSVKLLDIYWIGQCLLAAIANPDCKLHGAYMGPTRGRQDPCGPHEPCYQGRLLYFYFSIRPFFSSPCNWFVDWTLAWIRVPMLIWFIRWRNINDHSHVLNLMNI